MSADFLHLVILPAAMSIITKGMPTLPEETAGATSRIHAAEPALEELLTIGLCTNWNLPQILPAPLVDFLMMESIVVPALVE
jgi:hypothetical protein